MSQLTASALRSIKSGKMKPLVEKWRFFKMSTPEKYGGSYIKNAIAEIPEVLFFSFYAVGALGLVAKMVYDQRKYEEFSNRPYKHYYTVMRPDDERVKRIQREYYHRTDDIYDFSLLTATGRDMPERKPV